VVKIIVTSVYYRIDIPPSTKWDKPTNLGIFLCLAIRIGSISAIILKGI
jgi:hypothetical protein